MRPRLLVYEHAVMSPEDRAATRAEVEAAGYETLEEGNDTWCLDTGPDDRLSREWPGLRPGAPAYSIHDQPAGSAR